MATANLKSKISLDDTQFTAGLRRAKLTTAAAAKQIGTSFRKLGGIMANLAKSLARFAAIAGTITFAAAIAGAVKLGNALKKAFDAGGALSDLSAQTGIAVKELVILQQAFEDNGVAADQVGSVINKLQRSISDFSNGLSTQVRAFERLGITYDQLERKSPLQQFQMVQTAIARMEDPTMRAATAMEIFGRSGGNMLALFQDGNAISNAMVTVGGAADLLDKNATKFDRISDLLNSAGSKLQGFFVGVADVAADKILPVLEKFNRINFAQMGQSFAENFNMEKLIRVLQTGLIYAGESFMEFISPRFMEMADKFGRKLVESINSYLAGTELGAVLGIKAPKGAAGAGAAAGVRPDAPTTAEDNFNKALDDLFGKTRGKYFPYLSGAYDRPPTSAPPVMETPPVLPVTPPSKGSAASVLAGIAGSATGAHHGPRLALGGAMGMAGNLVGGKLSGLGQLQGMQLNKALGIGPGVGGTFAQDRKRLGIASGLQTGGLGAVRKVGAKSDATAARRDETIGGTNKRLEDTNNLLTEQNGMLQEALA